MSDGRATPNGAPAASSPQIWYACLYQPPAPGTFRMPGDPADVGSGPADGPVDRPAVSAPTGGEGRFLRGDPVDASGATFSATPRAVTTPLVAVAEAFSPRYEQPGADMVVIDVSGLDRLIGPPRVIGAELRRDAATRGLRVHVAVAATRIAAMILAHARPGVTVVAAGDEAAALAPLPIRVLEAIDDRDGGTPTPQPRSQTPAGHYRMPPPRPDRKSASIAAAPAFQRWGLRTLGEIAALPAADLRARLGPDGLRWQAAARGDDLRPLIPTAADERFESSMELEWPIEGAEPLSFVLTRLLEPLSTRLERRDRGAAALHVHLRLVTKEVHARRLLLPAPIRDVRTLRTLALLDLESHPPSAAIDHVALTVDPTPGRVVQHTLFSRAVPTPEQLATLLARLGALMGEDRIGAPALIDSYRPGAFAMTPFATEHEEERSRLRAEGASARRAGADSGRERAEAGAHRAHRDLLGEDGVVRSVVARDIFDPGENSAASALSAFNVDVTDHHLQKNSVDSVSSVADRSVAPRVGTSAVSPLTVRSPTIVSALRRCRQPVPARVAVGADARPVRVTTDRRGFTGGAVLQCAGPWRTSGEWWVPGEAGRTGAEVADPGSPGQFVRETETKARAGGWNRDEWDVALGDGAVYRIFRDRRTDGWFIDAIVD